jgi:aerobic-type carbon monoxide dehydrogenase small subunit (CoxS/CutS family)
MPNHVLTVNGRDHAADGEASLLDVLRDELGLYGAKYGCGEGRCGACCVLVDGEALPACTLRVKDVGARAIVTVEGLAAGDALTEVQDAFVAETAMQCGFCTTGMVIAATALLARSPAPSEAEIRQALDGHLCRCGVYGRVVRAVQRASGGQR